MITNLCKASTCLWLCLWGMTTAANAQQYTYENQRNPITHSYENTVRTSSSRWFEYDKPTYFGVRLGVNASTLFFRGMHGIETNPLCGMNIGMIYGIQLTDKAPLFFETGLLYTEKGVQIKATAVSQKITYRMGYVELPFVFKYKIDSGFDDFTIQPFFGGYFACGTNGRSKYYAERKKYKTFRHKTFKRPDAGFRLGCGTAYRNFYFEMSYDIGLANIAGKHYHDFGFDDFDDKIRTGNFSATIGLDF